MEPQAAPTIDLEKFCYIVVKAREFDEKVEIDDPDSGSNPTDDRSVAILEDFADDPTLQELTAALEALDIDEQETLLALLWVGRGDYAKNEWADALREAKTARHENLPIYVLGTPLLADYLEEGMSQFGMSCESVEMGRM